MPVVTATLRYQLDIVDNRGLRRLGTHKRFLNLFVKERATHLAIRRVLQRGIKVLQSDVAIKIKICLQALVKGHRPHPVQDAWHALRMTIDGILDVRGQLDSGGVARDIHRCFRLGLLELSNGGAKRPQEQNHVIGLAFLTTAHVLNKLWREVFRTQLVLENPVCLDDDLVSVSSREDIPSVVDDCLAAIMLLHCTQYN